MALPDLAPIAAAPDVLRALGASLRRLGVSPAAAEPVVNAVAELAPPLRPPMRAYLLRRMQAPLGPALRMFMFSDPVTEDEARTVCGAALERHLALGLLDRTTDGKVVSPFVLGALNELFVLSDDLARGGDAVMGFGASTIALCAAAVPRGRVKRVLDLGCGSGTGALLLSAVADHAVATDVTPRAVVMSRINAALNGVTLDVRTGDLFQPVANETFDVILSQPPFVPQPDEAAPADFLYGGRRGDELALRLLGELGPRLAPGGRAILYVDWPLYDERPLAERLRAALGPNPSLMLLCSPGISPESHATHYAMGVHPGLGPAFEREAFMRRAHLERERIRAVVPTLAVVEEQSLVPQGFTHVISVEPSHRIRFTGERIDKLLAGCALVADRERLLASRLRVPAGTILAQEQVGPGADTPSTLCARFDAEALVPACDLTVQLLSLVTEIHEAASVADGIAACAAALEMPPEAQAGMCIGVEQALLHGLLEVALGGDG